MARREGGSAAMADDDDKDFDVDLGDTGVADKGTGKPGADEVDDELEDLSREELYDRLKEANGTAKKYRLRLKRARSGAGRTSDRDDEDDDRGTRRRTRDDDRSTRDAGRRTSRDRDDDRDEDDDRRPARRSSRAEESEERAVRAEAKVALAAAGIPADRLTRAVRLIDLRSLELDGEDLLGIEEEIEDLKDEWPELFKRSRSSRDDDDDDRDARRRDSGTRRRVSRADTRAGGGTGGRDRGNKQKSSTELAAEQLLGQIGR